MRKRFGIVALALMAAVSLSQAGPTRKKAATPRMKLTTVQEPQPGHPGTALVLHVSVAPPKGIKLNRYPGITLKITKAKGFKLEAKEAFVGVKEPITNPEEFGFKHIDPLTLKVVPRSGGGKTRFLEGTLKFFYCVKKSGYCAPGTQSVKIPVTVD